MIAEQDGAVRAERRRHRLPLLAVEDQLRRALEDRHAVGEEDGVVRQQLERRGGRAERRGVRRMAVHDRSDVGPRL